MALNRGAWDSCAKPERMLDELRGRASGRKLRLLACANARRLAQWALTRQANRAAVEIAEAFADGLANQSALDAVRSLSDGPAHDAVGGVPLAVARCSLSAGWHYVRQQFGDKAFAGDEAFAAAWQADAREQANLIRHIFGNPFRAYIAPPSWPADVVRLAETLYAGADVAFALADALLEAGHPELAEHLRAEAWHPKGCWVVDLLTGRS